MTSWFLWFSQKISHKGIRKCPRLWGPMATRREPAYIICWLTSSCRAFSDVTIIVAQLSTLAQVANLFQQKLLKRPKYWPHSSRKSKVLKDLTESYPCNDKSMLQISTINFLIQLHCLSKHKAKGKGV